MLISPTGQLPKVRLGAYMWTGRFSREDKDEILSFHPGNPDWPRREWFLQWLEAGAVHYRPLGNTHFFGSLNRPGNHAACLLAAASGNEPVCRS